MKISHLAISLPVLTCLVSWSPPDDTVLMGPNNDTNGHSAAGLVVGPFMGIIAGRSNIVGSSPNGTGDQYAGIFGEYNEGNLRKSIVVGDHNQFSPTGNLNDWGTYMRQSGVIGLSNVMSTDLANSLIVGRDNTVNIHNSFVAGNFNSVEGAATGSRSIDSAVMGRANQVASVRGWIIGFANTVTGTNGAAIGSGLTASVDNSTAIGTWNAPMGPNDLLVVGNGSDDSNRSTALTILNNGSVIIPGEVTHSGNTILASATTQSLTVSGNVSLQGTTTAQNLTVAGNSTLQGSIIADDFNSTGTANLADLNATGTTTLSDVNTTTLDVSGNSTLADTTAQTLTVSGTTVLNGTVILAAPQGDISMGIYAP